MALDPRTLKTIQELRDSPQKILESARHGSIGALENLVNCWQHVPLLLTMGILDVFFVQLDENKVPTTPDRPANQFPDVERALIALNGLSGITILNFETRKACSKDIIEAWPGIFKWSAYFFGTRIQAPGIPQEARTYLASVISHCWLAVSNNDEVRKTMVSTVDSVEIATKLWVLEDIDIPSSIQPPVGSALLTSLLQANDVALLDRVVNVCGGKLERVASLAITRLRSLIERDQMDESRVAVLISLINDFSSHRKHPLCKAFLEGRIIHIITKTLAAVATQLNAAGDPALLVAMRAVFMFLDTFLESTDGVTWILQSLHAGFLTAFIECSPHFEKLDTDDFLIVRKFIVDIFPRYLVYRTVVDAVDRAMLKIQASPYMHAVSNSVARNEWNKFRELSLQRLMVAEEVSSKDKGVMCNNVKCQKMDVKHKFQKCSRCLKAYYCCKDCQQTAWKDGDHKAMCKATVQEECNGNIDGSWVPSKQDREFFNYLPRHDAFRNLATLRNMAARDFPSTPLPDLMIYIDYTSLPETYAVKPIAKWNDAIPDCNVYMKARTDANIEKARENPGQYILIVGIISHGDTRSIVLSLSNSAFWKGDSIIERTDGVMEFEGEWEEEDAPYDVKT